MDRERTELTRKKKEAGLGQLRAASTTVHPDFTTPLNRELAQDILGLDPGDEILFLPAGEGEYFVTGREKAETGQARPAGSFAFPVDERFVFTADHPFLDALAIKRGDFLDFLVAGDYSVSVSGKKAPRRGTRPLAPFTTDTSLVTLIKPGEITQGSLFDIPATELGNKIRRRR